MDGREITPVRAATIWDRLGPDPIAVISAVREEHPDLSMNGFGLARSYGFDRAKQRQSRAAMTEEHGVDEFMAAARFLTRVAPHRLLKPSPKRTSYGWKHVAERWAGTYVSNGMFLCAAIALGWIVRPIPDSPNATINLGKAALDLPRGGGLSTRSGSSEP